MAIPGFYEEVFTTEAQLLVVHAAVALTADRRIADLCRRSLYLDENKWPIDFLVVLIAKFLALGQQPAPTQNH